ncbi:ABC transporter substrate-binding protein [Schaalia sp. 19OD2882]|uniref:ABC transporter substrate-binding protein n=1 Tax=Schaalia sp. 19OD2882 TaxID=2794089 RepID=UPI001C1F0CF7|nr:ABC transporter substrate-binding protein [Schaalia sp. 19OD2882]QWW19526.1 ABC transporter substrate-binding protein [Schaalia sp. 19OD2882]
MRRGLSFALASLAAAAMVLTGCTPDALRGGQSGAMSGQSQDAPPSAPAAVSLPVELHAAGAPEGLRIGVLVTLTSNPGQGVEWAGFAEGARVAAERFAAGGTDVTLLSVDDRGTVEGAVAAVEDLAAKGVAGIVVASSGAHMDQALARAGELKLPVLLPYDSDPARVQQAPQTTWLTGPDDTQYSKAFSAALRSARVSGHVLLDVGGGSRYEPAPAETVQLGVGADPLTVKDALAQAVENTGAGAVVVSGPADDLARGVLAVQASGVQTPVFVTPEAISPRFADALVAQKASPSQTLTSMGLLLSDSTALVPGPQGEAMSAFLAGVRRSAQDPATVDLAAKDPFAQTAAAHAHPGAHDAVVALVRAAAKAKSAEPAKVADALRSLKLSHADGIVTPGLSFTSSTGVPDAALSTLFSTTQDVGLRPEVAKPDALSLQWFGEPTS